MVVGIGNFSKVFKGLYMGEMVAIKKCELKEEALLKYIKDELAILRRVNHPNVVGFIGAAKPPPKKEREFIYIGKKE